MSLSLKRGTKIRASRGSIICRKDGHKFVIRFVKEIDSYLSQNAVAIFKYEYVAICKHCKKERRGITKVPYFARPRRGIRDY